MRVLAPPAGGGGAANAATIELIKRWEGRRLHAYQDSAGVWTIGYGTTSMAGIGIQVTPGMTITDDQAEEFLNAALQKFADKIQGYFKREPTPNQFGAMLSLAYNIGTGAFANSTCLRRFNEGDFQGAAEALTWFNKCRGVTLQGLVNRRSDERQLFLS